MILLHAFENLMLISPAIYTYINVKNRHQFLEDTIGPVPLESFVMQRWEWIVTIGPSLILLSIPVQIGLIWAFNKYGHPWKRFFCEFSQQPKKSSNVKAIASTYLVG